MGAYYSEGAVAPDFAEARRWLLEAAKQDHAEARRRLGWLYHFVDPEAHDPAQAAPWYARDGRGGPPDPMASCFWFSLADRAGIAKATRKAAGMRPALSPEQITEAERRLAEWMPASRE
jgi:TPR repeat protein